MQITKAAAKVAQLHEVSGLFSCLLESEIKSTKAKFTWTGPKFHPEMWAQVCAFLRWGKAKHSSEMQMRFFVNVKEKRWAVWAFPQEGSSCNTKELESHERFAKDRERFGGTDWIQFGTIHSHPNSAFQSSVDHLDENRVDGIHITMGDLDKKKFDMHVRFYMAGNEFEPDMSMFYDVEDMFSSVPEHLEQFLPKDAKDKMARMIMTMPPPDNTEYPKEWEENFIKPEVKVYGGYSSGFDHWTPGAINQNGYKPVMDKTPNLDRCMEDVVELAWELVTVDEKDPNADRMDRGSFEEWVEGCVEAIKLNPKIEEFVRLLWRHDCTGEGLVKHMAKNLKPEHLLLSACKADIGRYDYP